METTTLTELDNVLEILPLEIMEDFFHESFGFYLQHSGDNTGEPLSMKYYAVETLLKIFREREEAYKAEDKGSRSLVTKKALEKLDELLEYIPFDMLEAYFRESFEYYIQYSGDSGEPLSIKYYTMETLLKILRKRIEEKR